MGRLPRYALPGLPQHVIQRGNNRSAMFAARTDFDFFRECLEEACAKNDCRIHAYVFMTNHVHLLMTPAAEMGIARVMQSVGRRYVRRFNSAYHRTGTLWEGRYRATPVDTERYLLACYRYVELNPVRARLVFDPADYTWSSFRANATGAKDVLITPHERYLSLGPDPVTRRKAYGALFRTSIDDQTVSEIREATNKAWALGGTHFRNAIERAIDRRTRPLPRGGSRPRDHSIHSDPID